MTSPTFTIGQRYAGAVPVSHLDLYRVADLGGEDPDLLADYIGPDRDRVRRVARRRGRDDRGARAHRRESRDRARGRRPSSGADRGPGEPLTGSSAAAVPVRILAFDTATRATAVALCGVGDVVYVGARRSARGRRPGHATRLLPLSVERARATRGSAGTRSSGSRSASAPERSPGCGSGSPPRVRSRRRGTFPLVGISTLQSLALAGARASQRSADAGRCRPGLT